MFEFTQSNLTPGNCWQTAVACVLETDPKDLPDQLTYATNEYSAALSAYLEHHHGLMPYVLYEPSIFDVISLKPPGWHLMSGPTVRTPHNRAHHVIVGRDGQPVWDPHPSRALLTEVTTFTLFLKATDQYRRRRQEQRDRGVIGYECGCPKCRIVSTIPAPPPPDPDPPRCPAHPSARVLNARRAGTNERHWICLVCTTELGRAPSGEFDLSQIETRSD